MHRADGWITPTRSKVIENIYLQSILTKWSDNTACSPVETLQVKKP